MRKMADVFSEIPPSQIKIKMPTEVDNVINHEEADKLNEKLASES